MSLTVAIVIVYFAIILSVGIRASRLVTSAEDFIVAGRNLGFVTFMLLVIGSVLSGMTVLGSSALAYVSGWPSMWEPIFVCASVAVLMTLFGAKLHRVSRRFKYNTVQDYLAHRYQSRRTIRALAGLSGIIISFIYLVGQYRAVSIVLAWLFDLPEVYALLIATGVIGLYVLLGGLMAVAQITFIQGMALLIGVIVLIPGVIKAAGGLAAINAALGAIDPHLVSIAYPQVHPPLGEHAFLTPLFLVSFFFLLTFGLAAAPHSINNILTARKASYYKWGPFWGFLIYIVVFYLIKFGGLASRVMVEAGLYTVPHPDYALLGAIEYILPQSLWAVFGVVVLAAVMSTTDRLLLTISASISWDIFHNILRPDASDEQVKAVSRWAVVITSVLAFLTALYPPPLLAWLVWMGIGLMLSTYCVPLLAGLYWSRANGAGAIAGMAAGLVGGLAAGYVHQFLSPLPFHFSLIGLLVSLITTVAVSLATPAPSEQIVEETESGIGFLRLVRSPYAHRVASVAEKQ
ncbi:MAG: sodium:solute symporter family protein [Limnochordia bacterium]